MKNIYDENGRLLDDFLPAIYFDTSFLIEYWAAEVFETPDVFEEYGIECPMKNYLNQLVRADRKIRKIYEIRENITRRSLRMFPVTSPLSIIEMIEWKAEVTFKQFLADSVGVLMVQRRGKKEIGKFLKHVLDDYVESNESNETGVSAVDYLMIELTMASSYVESHALLGIIPCDLYRFNITMTDVWETLFPYAFLQLGLADCLHLLAARHLGCTYFASLDEDFRRVREIVENELELIILSSVDEIASIIRRNIKSKN